MITEKEIYEFLKKVDTDFPIPLSEKINLEEFAQKLYNKAHIVATNNGREVTAVVAGYLTDTPDNKAYITICACLKEYRGMGISSSLVKAFIYDAARQGFEGVHLYTRQTNATAIKMYTRIGFERYDTENREGDVHLIYWINR